MNYEHRRIIYPFFAKMSVIYKKLHKYWHDFEEYASTAVSLLQKRIIMLLLRVQSVKA